MDGFHYTRAQLDAMPDPATAHARRGAEFTFDGEAFYQLVKRLKEPLAPDSPPVLAPSFDHAVKDPRADDIVVERTQRIVVLEGNCTSLCLQNHFPPCIANSRISDILLTQPPWSLTHPLLSHKIFVSVPPPLARSRLAARHLAAGLATTLLEGDRRAVENDLPNGEVITRLLRVEEVDDVVESLEEGGWAC